jgi:exopolysaccharide biosynthesis predicted pyruvyltransferase EpsI
MMRKAAFVFVRDHHTANLCESAGGTPTVTFCPAAVFLLKNASSRTKQRKNLLHAIHPSDLRFAEIKRDELRATLQMLAIERGLRYQELDHSTPVDEKTLRAYQEAAFVVSSRLHGCIFSYILGAPCLPICCDNKTKAFYTTHTNYEPPTAANAVNILKQGKGISFCAPATSEKKSEILTTLQKCVSTINLQLASRSAREGKPEDK